MAATSEETPEPIEFAFLDDIHGLWGGHAVYLNKNGEVFAQTIGPPPSLPEKRYSWKISNEEIRNFEALLKLHHFAELEISIDPIPDEGRPHLAVRFASGRIKQVTRPEHQKNPDFEAVQKWFSDLGIKARKKGKLVYSGPFQREWSPSWIHNRRTSD